MIDILLKNLLTGHKVNWKTRGERSAFVAHFAKQNSSKSILNVGSGGERAIAKYLDPGIVSFDIDFVGDVDLKLNLDDIDQLPFDNGSFDLVCAMDVLEHLENFYEINNEIYRVSSKIVLISLPNSAAEIPYIIANRIKTNSNIERGYFSKYYGLPIKKQMDRHRYWMYLQDIIRFYDNFSSEKGCKCEYIIPELSLKRKILKLIIGKRIFYTFFNSHVCIVINKEPE